MDTIELTIYRDDDGAEGRRVRLVRAHITHWWEQPEGTLIRTTCGETTRVAEDYDTVTRLLEGAPDPATEYQRHCHGIIDPRD